MTLEELMKRIHLPQAACETLWEERISEKEYKVWKDKFYQDCLLYTSDAADD